MNKMQILSSRRRIFSIRFQIYLLFSLLHFTCCNTTSHNFNQDSIDCGEIFNGIFTFTMMQIYFFKSLVVDFPSSILNQNRGARIVDGFDTG